MQVVTHAMANTATNETHVLPMHTKMIMEAVYAMSFGMKRTVVNGLANEMQNAFMDVQDLSPVTVYSECQTVIEILKIHESVMRTGVIQVAKHI